MIVMFMEFNDQLIDYPINRASPNQNALSYFKENKNENCTMMTYGEILTVVTRHSTPAAVKSDRII